MLAKWGFTLTASSGFFYRKLDMQQLYIVHQLFWSAKG
jgi:hypothetical protein